MKLIKLALKLSKLFKDVKNGFVLVWICDELCLVHPEKALIYHLVKKRIEFTSADDFENWYKSVSHSSEPKGEPGIMVFYRYENDEKMPLLWY